MHLNLNLSFTRYASSTGNDEIISTSINVAQKLFIYNREQKMHTIIVLCQITFNNISLHTRFQKHFVHLHKRTSVPLPAFSEVFNKL